MLPLRTARRFTCRVAAAGTARVTCATVGRRTSLPAKANDTARDGPGGALYANAPLLPLRSVATWRAAPPVRSWAETSTADPTIGRPA